jgi:hypothetical protein
LLAYLTVHAGLVPSFFSSTLVDAIIDGIDSITPGVDDISDEDLRESLNKVAK